MMDFDYQRILDDALLNSWASLVCAGRTATPAQVALDAATAAFGILSGRDLSPSNIALRADIEVELLLRARELMQADEYN